MKEKNQVPKIKKDRILYCSSKNKDVSYGRIFKNRIEILPPNSHEFNKEFKFIYSFDEDLIIENTNRYILYDVPNGLLLRGNFITKDDLGRNIGFLFYSETKDIQSFKQEFRDDSLVLGFETQDISNWSKRKLPLKYTISLSIVALLLLAYCLLYK